MIDFTDFFNYKEMVKMKDFKFLSKLEKLQALDDVVSNLMFVTNDLYQDREVTVKHISVIVSNLISVTNAVQDLVQSSESDYRDDENTPSWLRED
jgi:hypothetical protein